jgi:Zn finger protein HypA/HybF involved in hydrogenase expression
MTPEQELAEGIYRVLLAHVPADHAQPIRKVMLRCVHLENIDEAALFDAWERVAVGPAYAHSRLQINYVDPTAKCLNCAHTFELATGTGRCPRCHAEQFSLVHQPVTIETYELEDAP